MRQSTIAQMRAQGWTAPGLAAFLTDLATPKSPRIAQLVADVDVMKCVRCGTVQQDAERCADCGEPR